MDADDRPLVLAVDDDVTILGFLADVLGEEGYRVATAADGVAALARATDAPPALVLTDLAMPRMDGATLCHRLRADPRTAGAPLLVLTAMPASLAESALDGCPHERVLAKPFDVDDLLAAVTALCPLPGAHHLV
jgi:chemosensory pili system protein ChpA (sensor histidine kinase/response regulator)